MSRNANYASRTLGIGIFDSWSKTTYKAKTEGKDTETTSPGHQETNKNGDSKSHHRTAQVNLSKARFFEAGCRAASV